MQKRKTRKLILKRETLLNLKADALRRVAGADATDTCFPTDNTCAVCYTQDLSICAYCATIDYGC